MEALPTMRNFLFLRHPLPRRTLVFCHVVTQLALCVAGLVWLARHSPPLSGGAWTTSWPTLALGGGVWLLSLVGVRLLAELLMLPYHLAGLRNADSPGAVMTRAYDRRPAVHDPERRWVNAPVISEEAVGEARVTRPRQSLKTRLHSPTEPGVAGDAREAVAAPGKQRQEPSL